MASELFLPLKPRVLIVGSGGREHALGLRAAREGADPVFAPGNAGTEKIGENLPLLADDIDRLAGYVHSMKDTSRPIELTIVGPEAPLVDGIVNVFQEANLPIAGPTKEAAVLEGDKAWTTRLFQKYGISHPESYISGDVEVLIHFAKNLPPTWKDGAVAKFPGLAAGKGVIVPDTQEELIRAIQRIMIDKEFKETPEMILQRKMKGPEVSFIALTDGVHVVPFVDAGDYKRAKDGDEGPNTGGMGAVSPTGTVTPEIRAQGVRIIQQTVDAMRNEGITYRGPIYLGAMITDEGVQAIEFNCRFGDPETQVIMARMNEGLLAGLVATTQDNTLNQDMLKFKSGHAVSVVLASGGYPGSYKTGKEITELDAAEDADVDIIHAGTRKNSQGKIETSGGRVLAPTAVGSTREIARRRAYRAAEKIMFEGKEYRTDIGA